MDLGNGLGHLTYSTLVHPADDWEQLWNSLITYLPKVKARIAGNKSFGVCIRLAAQTAETLANSPAEREKLKKFLGDNDMYIYTANAFVYGHFKDELVKEQVYEPDWRAEERTQYTINVANMLADVCPAGIAPSIQSAPLGFKPRVTGNDVIASLHRPRAARRRASHRTRESKTGRTVQLALEPEPFCFLETTDETVAYFRNHLYSGAAVEKLAKLAHVPISEANAALRRHVGIVYDICHQAVEYENISESLQKLVDGGVPIFKFQEAAALHIPEVTQTGRRYAQALRQDDLSDADDPEEGRQADEVPQRRRRHCRLRKGAGAAGMAHAYPRAGLPRRSRAVPHHALCHRGRLAFPQAETAVAPSRSRDLYLGRPAREPQEGRHRR